MLYQKMGVRFALRNLPCDGMFPEDAPSLRRKGNAEKYIVISCGVELDLDMAADWYVDPWPLLLARDTESAIMGGLHE